MKIGSQMNWKVQAAFGSAILTLLVTGAISLVSFSVARENEHWVQHTHEVLENLQQLLLGIENAQSNCNAYLATGEQDRLIAYRTSTQSAQQHLAAVTLLTADNPNQQIRLPSLQKALAQQRESLEAAVLLRQTQLVAQPPALSGTAQQPDLSESIQKIVGALQSEELRLLAQRSQAARQHLIETNVALISGAILGLAITIAAAWSVQREGSRRNQAERALRQSEQRFRGLLQSSPDPLVVVDSAGKIVLMNAQTQRQFGYSEVELIGKNVVDILPIGFLSPSTSQQAVSPDSQAVQAGATIEVLGQRKDGTRFPAEITRSPFETIEGILTSAAVRDITERRQSERDLERIRRELERSNSELQQFTYVTSHDLQEPLRMVASYTQLLSKRYSGRLDADADEFISYAVEGCVRMKRLIQDLLNYSRAGAEDKLLRECSCEAILDEALANLKPAIEENSAVITRDPMPILVSDDTKLVQVFQNLIGNAIKYRSADTPLIHISARQDKSNEWIFSIRDNGRGIDPRYFEKIFVIFQRLQPGKGAGGTGIGLSICKRIIERLDGRIWVESLPGAGSTFYFALPQKPAVSPV